MSKRPLLVRLDFNGPDEQLIEQITFGLLICTSENQDLEKSRSISNLRKFSGPANMDFFSRSPFKKEVDL